ncbi:MAG: hypothetical protein H7Y00_03175, partial [Fimbriimonadaceae bacterium]|nr:hypothetical protein [Chitinophagales bacterium]
MKNLNKTTETMKLAFNMNCFIKNAHQLKIAAAIVMTFIFIHPGYCQETFQITAGNGANFGRKVITDPDGGYILTGYSQTPANSTDISVIYLSACGEPDNNIINIGGMAADYGYHAVWAEGIDQAKIIGETSSFGSGINDAFLVSPPSISGGSVTISTIGENLNDIGEYVIETSDNNLLITGRTNSAGAGQYDVFVAKVQYDGTMLWHTIIGGNLNDRGFAAKET